MLLNIAVNDFDAEESVPCRQVLVVIELVVTGPSVLQSNWNLITLL